VCRALVLAAVVFPLLLVGCRTRGFVREGATAQEFYQDLRDCEAEASAGLQFCWGAMCDRQAAQQKRRRNICMQARGWELSREDRAFRP
jgi:hypothetical protein